MYNMLMQGSRTKIARNQQGFASLVIAMVIILVLSLITLGFAQLMRQEQRSALDRHLSSQAYYAAEAGINDAAKAINDGYADTKADCDPLPTPGTPDATSSLTNSDVGNASSYTCLLIDPAPFTLDYGAIDFDQSNSMLISGADPTDPAIPVAINDLVISWQDSGAGNTFIPAGGGNVFYPINSWPASTTVLKIGLTPLNSVSITRENLIARTYTAFLYPKSGSAATNLATWPSSTYVGNTGVDSGVIVDGKCNTASKPRFCNVRITGLDKVDYLLNLRSMAYGKSRVTIEAYGVSGTRIRIKNAQTLVDSTGKAADVLRRVQVRIPTRNTYQHTDYGLEVKAGICKQLKLYPSSTGFSNTNNPLCI